MIETTSDSLEARLKALWGASRLPGFADSTVTLRPPHWQEPWRRLQQLVAVQASGLVHGPHGVGKSFLLHRLSQELSPKQYRVIRLVHSTLMGSDLLRQLVRLGGMNPNYRRSENVLLLRQLWQQTAPLWPVLILEEAQNLSAPALEELRLLACERSDTQPPFSLLLVGDEDLLPPLHMGVNRALLSRLGFSLALTPWPLEALRDYLQQRLAEVSIHKSPFDPAAEQLLLQSAAGRPRHLNDLLQRSLENAALASGRQVMAEDVQAALDTLPWVATHAPPRS
jgi:type II secretory pathway predicted ATPase ExeA